MAQQSKATDDSMIEIEFRENETMRELLLRIGIDPNGIGELFVNHKVVELDTNIEKDNSRVAIFPEGMHLLCGGQHLKGPGYIKKKEATKQFEYW